MSCPRCYSTMVEVDDVGNGDRGEECVVCGYTISDRETLAALVDGADVQYLFDNDDKEN